MREGRVANSAVIASEAKQSKPSFRDGAKHQTRNLEIPGSMLRIAPE